MNLKTKTPEELDEIINSLEKVIAIIEKEAPELVEENEEEDTTGNAELDAAIDGLISLFEIRSKILNLLDENTKLGGKQIELIKEIEARVN